MWRKILVILIIYEIIFNCEKELVRILKWFYMRGVNCGKIWFLIGCECGVFFRLIIVKRSNINLV